MTTGLIFDYSERQQRAEYKKQALLSWLVDFTWTTPDIAGQVMGLKTRAGINKTLNQLIAQSLIKEDFIQLADRRKLRVVGISPDGLLWSDSEAALTASCFDPNRVAISTLMHRLDVQRCRLKVRNISTHWIPESNLPKELEYRPDAIFSLDEKAIALELERTAKTRKRYQKIIALHLRQIYRGHYTSVHYVSTVPGFASRLERLFFSISKLPTRGQQVLFDKHLKKRFKFYDYERWLDV